MSLVTPNARSPADSGCSLRDPYRSAIRPIEASEAAIRNGCFTSTPAVPFAQIAEVRRGHGERRCLKYMRSKPMQVNVSPSQNALGYC
jgi:hypothetical protein